jgi:hypothetical protein|tara:strand:- start:410 stop:688 length:279 start_codon:yes stop_codon:yes gene_type:complete
VPQIVGLEAHNLATWADQRALLVEHLQTLRRQPSLQKLPIVLVVESNLGFEAAHNARYVLQAGVENVYVAHERGAMAESAATRTPTTMDQFS